MAVEVLRAADRAAVPWLNGGGVTREVAAGPAGAGMTDFAWRVSLADVARGGPFSVFADTDRVITLVEGAGMTLTVAGAEQALTEPFRPFVFPGDAATDCRLEGGPVVDFNVMTRRGRASAQVEIADAPRPVRAPEGGVLLVVCLAGTAALASAGYDLDRYDAVLLHHGGDLLQVDGAAAVVTIRQ
ncbi:HutD family protein [Kitasatospora sp. NPDC093679]|uniref:HutD/Ves family protein n=1 Tax=Kitasatospora sp. NPDC093679 TaxID=3154983 RepID=UPI00341B1C02